MRVLGVPRRTAALIGANALAAAVQGQFQFVLPWMLLSRGHSPQTAAIAAGLVYAPLLMVRRGERNGQTLGKQAMGIRVVRPHYEPVTLGNALLREVIGRQLLIVITVYVYALFDYLWPIWDRQSQALHDKVATTWVVRTAVVPPVPGARAPLPPPPPTPTPRAPDAPVRGWLPPSADG